MPAPVVFDIDQMCALWAAGQTVPSLAKRFSVAPNTVWRYTDRYATPEQKAARELNASCTKDGRLIGRPTASPTRIRESETVDWRGAQFGDDPRAVQADRYGRAPPRPASFVPTEASA